MLLFWLTLFLIVDATPRYSTDLVVKPRPTGVKAPCLGHIRIWTV